MYQDKLEWVAHQRRHWMRPNAHLWFRPDAERWMGADVCKSLVPDRPLPQPQSDARENGLDLAAEREWLRRIWREVAMLTAEIRLRRFFHSFKAGFKPGQPRWPKGSGRISGRRSRGAGTSGPETVPNSGPTRNGHHFVPREIFDDPALTLPPETRRVFEQGVTGTLNAGPHRWSKEHGICNDAVKEHFNRFVRENGIQTDKMTPEQARTILDAVKRSTDPRVRGLNIRIYRREIFYWIRRIGRGSE